jgi:hypothetical protein
MIRSYSWPLNRCNSRFLERALRNRSMASNARLEIFHVVCSDAFASVEHYVAYTANALSTLGHGNQRYWRGSQCYELDVEAIGCPVPPRSQRMGAVRMLSSMAMPRNQTDLVDVHMTKAELAAIVTRSLLWRPAIATLHSPVPAEAHRCGTSCGASYPTSSTHRSPSATTSHRPPNRTAPSCHLTCPRRLSTTSECGLTVDNQSCSSPSGSSRRSGLSAPSLCGQQVV